MRSQLGFLMIGVLAACGAVESSVDAPPGPIDAPSDDGGAIDAPLIDAPLIDAPAGPMPVLYWSLDNNVDNTGALAGYALTTPAGIGYGAGKFGQAAAFGAGQYSYVDGMRTSLDTYAKVTIGFWLREPGTAQGSAFLDCNNRATSPYGGVQLGLTGPDVSLCVSTTSNSYLSGGCAGFTAPSANTWHHWLLRYDGVGTAAGQGGPTQIYIDDVLVHTRANDTANNPVFNTTGTPDRLYLGLTNASLDDVRIYNQVFSPADQCTYVVRGTWSGTSCVLP
ncbi:MAG: hypothetical protein IPL61_37475 [Myxococcales bacterium]|nr:hypothetical protein [Myxococcales bacterium]